MTKMYHAKILDSFLLQIMKELYVIIYTTITATATVTATAAAAAAAATNATNIICFCCYYLGQCWKIDSFIFGGGEVNGGSIYPGT